MQIISSLQNPLIKDTKKLRMKKYREEQGQFLAEGIRLTEEALKKAEVHEFYYEEKLLENPSGSMLLLTAEKSGASLYQVSPQVMKDICETESPQGVAAVVKKELISFKDFIPAEQSLLVIVDGLQDPGNLGTIIRTAWAAGADAVMCLSGTVDPYNSKAVRATMGGIFNIPIFVGLEWHLTSAWCRTRGYQLVAGDLHAQKDYYRIGYGSKTAVIIGNEGQGLRTVDIKEIDHRVKIPLYNEAESLNAAVACGVLLYEIIRQRLECR